MAFWNVPNDIVPKQSHRWVVQFGDNRQLTFLAKSIDRPSYTIGSTQAKYLYSHTINFPNRVKWNPVTITLYDALTSDVLKEETTPGGRVTYGRNRQVLKISEWDVITKDMFSTEYFFYNMLKSAGYDPDISGENPAGMKYYTFKNKLIEKLLGKENVLTIKEILGASPEKNSTKKASPFEQIVLHNPIVTDFKFGTFDYASDAVLTITLTLNYDWATFQSISNVEKTSPRSTLLQEPISGERRAEIALPSGFTGDLTSPNPVIDERVLEGSFGSARGQTSLGADINGGFEQGLKSLGLERQARQAEEPLLVRVADVYKGPALTDGQRLVAPRLLTPEELAEKTRVEAAIKSIVEST